MQAVLYNRSSIVSSPAQQLILTQEMVVVKKTVFKKLDDNNMAWEVERLDIHEPETTEIHIYHAPWTVRPRSNLAHALVLQPVISKYLWHFAQLFTNIICIRMLA